jgi:hypothetical protein
MTYENPFGGTWVWDESNPLNVSCDVFRKGSILTRAERGES